MTFVICKNKKQNCVLLQYVLFRYSKILAEVGNACKVNLILQTIVGVSLVGLAEALALGKFCCEFMDGIVFNLFYFYLADRFSISLKDIIDIFELTSMKSQLLLAKGKGEHCFKLY